MGHTLFPKGMPAPAVIWDQIQLAQLSTTVYAMLPVLGEFFIEDGYTRYNTNDRDGKMKADCGQTKK